MISSVCMLKRHQDTQGSGSSSKPEGSRSEEGFLVISSSARSVSACAWTHEIIAGCVDPPLAARSLASHPVDWAALFEAQGRGLERAARAAVGFY